MRTHSTPEPWNGDENLDLAVANFYSDSVSILLGGGTGNFVLGSTATTGSEPRTVAVADMNQDGKPDLVTSDWGDGSVDVLLGDGTGNFTLNSSTLKQEGNCMGEASLKSLHLSGDRWIVCLGEL
ncbi:MAG: VCBS repeat-containing protein [Acidobacteriales bacterium]|nr:VCBS repeat-containing protein [Terriglobales bacterium]